MSETVEQFHARQVQYRLDAGLPPTIASERVLGLLAAVLAAHYERQPFNFNSSENS